MSTNTLNTGNTGNTVEATQDAKDILLSGAKVTFDHNGSEFVYTIDGVRDLEISTKGYIIDKGEKKFPKDSNDTVYITARKGVKAVNIAYKSLILLLNGYVPKGGFIVKLREDHKGFSPDNIYLVSKFNQAQEISFDTLERVSKPVLYGLEEEDKTVVETEGLYTKKAAKMHYVAEDGMSFEGLEACALHQRAVTAAKEVAQIVLDYNKGLYGVAEKAFLQVMHYEDETKKPYKNFRDVMDNNLGVQEQIAQEVVQFNKFKIGQEPMFAHLFSNKSYTQETANEIVDVLGLAKDLFHRLEMLSKLSV